MHEKSTVNKQGNEDGQWLQVSSTAHKNDMGIWTVLIILNHTYAIPYNDDTAESYFKILFIVKIHIPKDIFYDFFIIK